MLAIELGELIDLLPTEGFDVSLTGFETPEIDLLLDDMGPPRPEPEDILPALHPNPATRRGDLWQLKGDHHAGGGSLRWDRKETPSNTSRSSSGAQCVRLQGPVVERIRSSAELHCRRTSPGSRERPALLLGRHRVPPQKCHRLATGPLGGFPVVCRVAPDDMSNSWERKMIAHHHDPIGRDAVQNGLARQGPGIHRQFDADHTRQQAIDPDPVAGYRSARGHDHARQAIDGITVGASAISNRRETRSLGVWRTTAA
jgi:hypothetical protein